MICKYTGCQRKASHGALCDGCLEHLGFELRLVPGCDPVLCVAANTAAGVELGVDALLDEYIDKFAPKAESCLDEATGSVRRSESGSALKTLRPCPEGTAVVRAEEGPEDASGDGENLLERLYENDPDLDVLELPGEGVDTVMTALLHNTSVRAVVARHPLSATSATMGLLTKALREKRIWALRVDSWDAVTTSGWQELADAAADTALTHVRVSGAQLEAAQREAIERAAHERRRGCHRWCISETGVMRTLEANDMFRTDRAAIPDVSPLRPAGPLVELCMDGCFRAPRQGTGGAPEPFTGLGHHCEVVDADRCMYDTFRCEYEHGKPVGRCCAMRPDETVFYYGPLEVTQSGCALTGEATLLLLADRDCCAFSGPVKDGEPAGEGELVHVRTLKRATIGGPLVDHFPGMMHCAWKAPGVGDTVRVLGCDAPVSTQQLDALVRARRRRPWESMVNMTVPRFDVETGEVVLTAIEATREETLELVTASGEALPSCAATVQRAQAVDDLLHEAGSGRVQSLLAPTAHKYHVRRLTRDAASTRSELHEWLLKVIYECFDPPRRECTSGAGTRDERLLRLLSDDAARALVAAEQRNDGRPSPLLFLQTVDELIAQWAAPRVVATKRPAAPESRAAHVPSGRTEGGDMSPLLALLALPLRRRQRFTEATSASPLSPYEFIARMDGLIYEERLEDIPDTNDLQLEFITRIGAHSMQSAATVRVRNGHATGDGEITHILNDANDRFVTSGKYREGAPVKKHLIHVHCDERDGPVHEVQVDVDEQSACAVVVKRSFLTGHDWSPPDPGAGPHRLEEDVRYTPWLFYARRCKVDGEGHWVTPGEAYAGVRRAGGPKPVEVQGFNEPTREWYLRGEDAPEKRAAQMRSTRDRGTRSTIEFNLGLPGVPEAMADGPRKDAALVHKERRDRARAREERYDDPLYIGSGPTEARDRSHLRRGADMDYTEAEPGAEEMEFAEELEPEDGHEGEAEGEPEGNAEGEPGPFQESMNRKPPPDTVHMRPAVEWDGEPKAVPAVDSRGTLTDLLCRWVSEGVYYFCRSDLEFIPALQPYHQALILDNVSREIRVQVCATERGYEVNGNVLPNKEVHELYEAERVIPIDPAAGVRAEVTLIRRNTIPSELDTFLNSLWNKKDRTEMHFRAAHEIRAPHLQAACNRMRLECGERHKDSVLCAHGTPPHNCKGILTEGFRLSAPGKSSYPLTVCVAPNFKMCLGYTEGFDEARGFKARGDSRMLIIAELFYDPDNKDEVKWSNSEVGDPQACKIRELLVPRYIIWLGPEQLCDHVDELASKIEPKQEKEDEDFVPSEEEDNCSDDEGCEPPEDSFDDEMEEGMDESNNDSGDEEEANDE